MTLQDDNRTKLLHQGIINDKITESRQKPHMTMAYLKYAVLYAA